MSTAATAKIDDKPFFTPVEVARIFSVSDRTIRNWAAGGKLKVVRIGRTVRIPRSELVRLAGE